jgi:hypothetical protein
MMRVDHTYSLTLRCIAASDASQGHRSELAVHALRPAARAPQHEETCDAR